MFFIEPLSYKSLSLKKLSNLIPILDNVDFMFLKIYSFAKVSKIESSIIDLPWRFINSEAMS